MKTSNQNTSKVSAKIKNFWVNIKANKGLVIGTLIMVLVYTLVLGGFGVFGDTLK